MFTLNQQARYVIDSDGKAQDQDVNGTERHVKIATGGQQHTPPRLVRQREVQGSHHREENEEFLRVEQHGSRSK